MKIIEINNLDFGYNDKTIFKNLSLEFQSNNCYILAGLNGCGKSTLLKMIGGKVLCEYEKIKVLNKDPFRDTSLNNDVTYIDNDWGKQSVAFTGYNMPLQSSLQVKEMMLNVKKLYPQRNKKLLEVLDINPEWRLNAVSEGQRKRVQLYLNLIRPFKICLLDEITVNLDLLVKDKFMNYLKNETKNRECCIIYVTHIFDGLEDWATKLIHMDTNQKMTTYEVASIPNIYRFLLEKFKLESKNRSLNIEREDNNIDINLKNAGGYSHGVINKSRYN
jgi:CCR4-NOT complex subunit CAF16